LVQARRSAQSSRAAAGAKRAVFIDEEVATRFGSDEELEQALRALIEASDHVRKTG
jgi:hypothetical protein